MARARLGHLLVLAIAGAVGLALVALVFFRIETAPLAIAPRFDLGRFFRGIPEHRGWLLPFALLTALLPAWRALVWRLVLPPPAPRYRETWHATALGALVHNAIPGKLGPLAAAWLLGRFTGGAFGASLSSQLVAKLLELSAVVVIGAMAVVAAGGDRGGGQAAIAGAVLVAALALGAAALARGGPGAAARLAARRPRAAAFVGAAAEGVRGIGSAARLGRAFAAALLPPLTAAAAYALPLHAFGVEGALAGGAMLLAAITFGQLTPGLPVGAGVYYALAAFTARRLGASEPEAAALAVLSHATTVATLLLVGLASALVRRDALVELVRRRRELGRIDPSTAAGAPAGGGRGDARRSDARSGRPT